MLQSLTCMLSRWHKWSSHRRWLWAPQSVPRGTFSQIFCRQISGVQFHCRRLTGLISDSAKVKMTLLLLPRCSCFLMWFNVDSLIGHFTSAVAFFPAIFFTLFKAHLHAQQSPGSCGSEYNDVKKVCGFKIFFSCLCHHTFSVTCLIVTDYTIKYSIIKL